MASAKKKNVHLGKEETLQLIGDVQMRTVLWSKKNPAYKNIYTQNDIWSELGAKYNMSMEEIKRYWASLRSTFRSNFSKVKASVVTGTSSSSVFVPTWYGYSAMCFLKETSDVGDTIDSLSGAPTSTPTAEPHRSRSPSPSANLRSRSPHPPYRIPLPTGSARRPCPRSRNREDPLADKALETMISMMETIQKRAEKSHDAFLTYVNSLLEQKREEDLSAIKSQIIALIETFPNVSRSQDMPQCSGISPPIEYEEEYLDVDTDSD